MCKTISRACIGEDSICCTYLLKLISLIWTLRTLQAQVSTGDNIKGENNKNKISVRKNRQPTHFA